MLARSAYNISGAAVTGASAGLAVLGGIGGQLIRATMAAGKTSSRVVFSFVQGGSDTLENGHTDDPDRSKKKVELLSKPLNIVSNGLSIPASFSENQFKKINCEITDDLTIIKGQNELLFLSNSIRYFVESHIGRTGVDRGISHALQYDVRAVTNYLHKNSAIRFPGYLLHQCTALSETIMEMNVFYDAIIHGGHVKHWTLSEANIELRKFFGVEGNKKIIQNYIPFGLQIPIKRELMAEATKKSMMNLSEIFKLKSEEINEVAHDALFILESELAANENLEYEVSKCLEREPGNELYIEAPAAMTARSA